MRKVSLFIFLSAIMILLNPCFVLADVFTVKLPPPPSGVDNFVVGYMPNLGTYRLGSTNYEGSIHISGDGVLVTSNGEEIIFGDRYELSKEGAWVKYTSAVRWVSWYNDIVSVDAEFGKVIVFSSNDFYGTDGQLLAAAASDDILEKGLSVIGNQLTSSKILMYMFSPFRQIIPFIVFVVVSLVIFYKAWGWLRGQAQGF